MNSMVFRITICFCSGLYTVTEKGRENDGGTDNEKARPEERHDGLGDALFPCVHFDINLERGHDGENRGDGVADIQDIQHHRHHVVVHRGKRIRAPTVIHAAAFRHCRTGDEEP